ncbi:MAG: hypothetical protein ICV66_05840, partial [Chitinophagaceae bacterium]|nr:hypothetical protein [Chitinophagaceae bacterium]
MKGYLTTITWCIINTCVAQITYIPFKSTWKYLDDGSNQGTVWRTASFNDSAWKSGLGKFGYGITDANTIINFGPSQSKKYITTYFRKTVSLSDPAQYSSFSLNIKRDDGVVVYINGVEALRNNMPTGSVSYTTLAYNAADNGSTTQSCTIKPSYFKLGENLIAVEIHQAKANSTDMAFDLELKGRP